jgi:hypothetical protein
VQHEEISGRSRRTRRAIIEESLAGAPVGIPDTPRKLAQTVGLPAMLSSYTAASLGELLTTGLREDQVLGLLKAFSRQFPTISYQLVPSPALLNAQALVVGGQRIVKLYGGLAFNPLLDMNAIAFALLHETGHHLAVGSRLPWNPFLACECQADQWALKHCAFGRSSVRVDLIRALSDLDYAFTVEGARERWGVDTNSRSAEKCWSGDWKKRCSSLRANEMLPSDYICPLRELSRPPG